MAAVLASANAEAPIVDIAAQFLARASSTSEVLTLNLTNLLILLVLKALIFGFGLFSFGNIGKNQYERASARSSDSSLVKSSDLTGGMCFMMYVSGDEEKMSCIQRTACEDPATADGYLSAAKLWYKMHQIVKSVPFGATYYDTMKAVQDATEHAVNGGDCAVYQW